MLFLLSHLDYCNATLTVCQRWYQHCCRESYMWQHELLLLAVLLRFEYLTLWPWTCVTCCTWLWDNFHQVWTSSIYLCLTVFSSIINAFWHMLSDGLLRDMSHRRVFCSRPRQSSDRTFTLLDRKNNVTSLSRLVLGAKQPVISHINSQPCSSLTLQHSVKTSFTGWRHEHQEDMIFVTNVAVRFCSIIYMYSHIHYLFLFWSFYCCSKLMFSSEICNICCQFL